MPAFQPARQCRRVTERGENGADGDVGVSHSCVGAGDRQWLPNEGCFLRRRRWDRNFISSKGSYFGETCLKRKGDSSGQPYRSLVCCCYCTGPSGGSGPARWLRRLTHRRFQTLCETGAVSAALGTGVCGEKTCHCPAARPKPFENKPGSWRMSPCRCRTRPPSSVTGAAFGVGGWVQEPQSVWVMCLSPESSFSNF